ncbi:aspartyl-phosphate phosphatase Spo0E family protein [Bacillus suaedae]|uniref:Aspartyl-phosphate phosphatase Spo0E family protein n=1 Tax=Halalkalibacter suaedae TaxID=2822140 RepID=A0A940WPC3_9BACI|nr:aspartyl-phosphate phosphatase Spo0E family protein [Bacillus suaedae]MBP3949891.1 aspartyl-phosphate phosphatase Spo0E family protein [Bacillus suaedae]
MSKAVKRQDYMDKIEELRTKMIVAARKYGMNHPLVLHYSQELDTAHNQMMMMTKPASPFLRQSVEC